MFFLEERKFYLKVKSIIEVKIYQGNNLKVADADVNIVIDVIRAFTVSAIAFERGVEHIILVKSIEDAFRYKEQNNQFLIAGERQGLAIEGFDLDNSPHNFSKQNLRGRVLVQTTSNGTKAVLNSLNAKEVFVTGLATIETVISHLKSKKQNLKVNIIASHPTGDEDLACAEYINSSLTGNPLSWEHIINRCYKCDAAVKFTDPQKPAFKIEDLAFCFKKLTYPFLMRVVKDFDVIKIVKEGFTHD